jgi:hypothetical protein
MKIDYWTLMLQPKRFVELFALYNEVESKIKEENYKKAEMKARRKRYGR